LVVQRCLAAAGTPADSVDLVSASLTDATRALAAGKTDALAFVSGFPIPAVVELADRMALRALDLADVVAPLVAAWGPQYVVGPLPAGPYRLPSAVRTVSVKTYLVAAPSLPEDLAAGLTAVVFDRQEAIRAREPTVRQPTEAAAVFTEPVPLHPGSLRWFQERDSAAR
jgi:TRAP transporter TAXI family solute receptor